MSFLWPFIFIVLLAGSTIVVYNNRYNLPFYQAHQYLSDPLPKKELERLEGIQVPTVNQQQCYENEYCNCPRYNGTYEQCTNNYMPSPNQNHCDCNNRSFELCPWPFKMFESWYREKPSRLTADNFKTIPHHPKDQLFMDIKEVTKVEPKESGPFGLPPANVRAF